MEKFLIFYSSFNCKSEQLVILSNMQCLNKNIILNILSKKIVSYENHYCKQSPSETTVFIWSSLFNDTVS